MADDSPGGIGHDFLPNADLQWSLQTGPTVAYYLIENESWQTDPGWLIGWSANWKTPWPFDITHSGQPALIFINSNSYKFESKTAISYPIYRGLLFELSLEADRIGVSKSGTGGDKDDIKWVMGLGYRW